MKKALVVLMALVLTMAMFAASAEAITFGFATVTNNAGEELEGDFSAYEGATMTIDDEAMTCVFNDGSNETNYTLEIVEQTEDAMALLATAEDGSEEVMIYYAISDTGYKTISLVPAEDVVIIFVEM